MSLEERPRDPRDMMPLAELFPPEIDFVADNVYFGSFFCRDCATAFNMPYPNKKNEVVLISCPKCQSEHVETKCVFGEGTLSLEMKG